MKRNYLWGAGGVVNLALSALLVFPLLAGAAPQDKVTICHATASDTNPFVVNSVDENSIINDSGHGNSGINEGDIIPPFDYMDGTTVAHYPGHNWTTANEALFNNDCNMVQSATTGSLVVKKVVVGGTAQASDFSLHVKNSSNAEVTNSPQAGSTTGTTYNLEAGAYTVSETGGPSGYTPTFLGCSPSGQIAVVADQNVICTVTNTFSSDLGGAEDVNVTIVKQLDGQMATANSVNNYAFPMTATWNAQNIGSGTGTFTLSPTGFNNPNDYEATTAQMSSGANYSTSEITSNIDSSSRVLPSTAPCETGKFRLMGYSTGNTLAEAESAAISTTAPSFTGLVNNKFVVVHNETCANASNTVLHLIKVECPNYGVITGNFEANQIDATGGHFTEFTNASTGFTTEYSAKPISVSEIPQSCHRVEGWQFKLSSDQAQTQNVQMVTTNANGEANLTFSGLSPALQSVINSGQRIWVSEVMQNTSTFGALRCYNDARNGDNLEFVQFLNNSFPSDASCIAYNVALPANQQLVKVHILKYLDGQLATSTSAAGYQFPMTATWHTANLNGGVSTSGNYVLGNNHGGATDQYGADTSAMQVPADYTTSEITSNLDSTSQVLAAGSECQTGKFRLVGYSQGNTLAEAISGSQSTTAPNFTDLTADKYVIVHNETCPVPPQATQIHFIKVVCPSFASIAGNTQANEFDATNGQFVNFSNFSNTSPNFPNAVTPVNPSEIPQNCVRAAGWQFLLSSDQGQNNNQHTVATGNNGEVVVTLNDLPSGLSSNLSAGGQLWVSEVAQNSVAVFGQLRCNTDALFGDNLEQIQFSGNMPANVYCIAYNVGEVCGVSPCVTQQTAAIVSGTNTHFVGLTTTAPSNLSDASQFTGGTPGAAVAASPTGFPGAWDAAANDPSVNGAIFVNNSATMPTNPAGAGGDGTVNTWRLFTQSFTVPAGATNITATLHFTGDNSATAFLDNVSLGTASNFGAISNSSTVNLTTGTHTLAFAVKNDAFQGATNPTGLIYRLDLSFCGEGNVSSGGGGGGGSSSATDLAITKTVNNSSPATSTNVTYTITATNNGPDTATGVSVSDLLPSGTSFISSAPSVGSYNSSTGVWNIGTLNNGASATMTLVATVSAGAGATVINTSTVSGNQTDNNTANNTASANFTVPGGGGGGGGGVGGVVTTDLALTKTVSTASPLAGSNVAYTLSVINNGPNAASNVTVSDLLPAGVSFVSAVAGTGSYNNATGVWTIGNLNSGASATLSIVATVTAATGTTVINTGTVQSAVTDSNPGNNTASANFTVPNGQVLGETTETPSNPQVLGETTALPRTGLPLGIAYIVVLLIMLLLSPRYLEEHRPDKVS